MTIYRSTKVLPYVYMGIHRETGQFYIGSRTAKSIKLPPEQDLIKYRTSSKIVKPIFDEFDWHIVAMFVDPIECYNFEQELIFENWDNALKLNKSYHKNSIKQFNMIGKVYTDEEKDRLKSLFSEDRRKSYSLSRIGENNPMYGKRGELSPNYGRKLSDEHVEKIKIFMTTFKHSDQTKQLLSQLNTGENNPMYGKCGELSSMYGVKHTDEAKRKMSESKMGDLNHNFGKNLSKEIRNKIANSKAKTWEITAPDGEVFVIKNLTQFCKGNGLSQRSMSNVACGRSLHHEKWKCKRLD
jgi:hypothetical protein